jgi:hypothetical protein
MAMLLVLVLVLVLALVLVLVLALALVLQQLLPTCRKSDRGSLPRSLLCSRLQSTRGG